MMISRSIFYSIFLPLIFLPYRSLASDERSQMPKWVLTHTMGMMPATNGWGLYGMFPETEFARTRPPTYWSTSFGGVGENSASTVWSASMMTDNRPTP